MYNMTTGYLEHFGIKGMHWGIRHDKEYEKKRRNSRNAKAKKYEDKSKQLQTKIDDIKNQLKITSPNSYKYYLFYSYPSIGKRDSDRIATNTMVIFRITQALDVRNRIDVGGLHQISIVCNVFADRRVHREVQNC